MRQRPTQRTRCLCLLAAGFLVSQPITPTVIVVDGVCTLEDAITAANSNAPQGSCPAGSATDEIQLTADVILQAPLPALSGEVTVEGNGFRVSRDPAAPDFSILSLVSTEAITLRSLTLSNGRAEQGGGIFNQATGPVTITNSTITGNIAFDDGGGIHNVNNGQLTVENSAIVDNRAGDVGGGVASFDSVATLLGSTISNNEAARAGGGFYGFSTVTTIVESTLSNNQVDGSGGVSSTGGGGLYSGWDSTLILSDSTVSGNSSGTAGGGLKLYGYFGDDSLVNSTVTGNVASGSGGGLFAGGYYHSVSLSNVTITGNSTEGGGNSGGIFFYTSDLFTDGIGNSGGDGPQGFLNLANVIVANNSGGNCVFSNTTPTGVGANFDDDGSCLLALPITAGVDFEVAAADNGGPTLTHALLPGSVAIDAAGDCGLATDQRGFPRDQGACDSGAYERVELTVAITGECPGVIDVVVATSDPNQRVGLFVGPGAGTSSVPSGPCAGTELEIDLARPWRIVRTNSTGSAVASATVPVNWCGRVVQAVDESCALSNVTPIP